MTHKRIRNAERANEIAQKYRSGMTLHAIGEIHGITRERVRQILSAQGLEKMDGGAAIRSFLSTSEKVSAAKLKQDKAEARCFAAWGMTVAEYRSYVQQHGSVLESSSPLRKYAQQRKNAKTRGIEWGFTLPQWLTVWQESGKLEERGRGKCVMARYGDIGPYAPSNVYICTQSENSKDSFIASPAAERFAGSRNSLGKGKGYYYSPTRSKSKPYCAHLRNKHIGMFATEEEARAAYLAAIAGEPIYHVKTRKILTEADVMAIRADERAHAEIARELGFERSTITRIKNGQSYKHFANSSNADEIHTSNHTTQ